MNEGIDRNEPNGSGSDKEIGALEALWSFFSSMKTAIVLLLILALASIVGTVIVQNQLDADYVKAYGAQKFAIIKTLGLTDVYHSTWYSVLLAMVGVGLAVCSINRFGMAWRRTFQPQVAAGSGKVEGMQRSEKLAHSGSIEDAAGKAAVALRSRFYRVSKETRSDGVSLHAVRGRLSVWGPYLTHVSILVIFIAAIFGNMLGYEGFTTVTEGKRTSTYYPKGSQQKKKLGFELALRKFTIEHKHHQATAYKSDLSVYDRGRLITRKVVDVNHPLSYKGLSFFQTDFGLDGFVVKVTAPDGRVAWLPFNVETRDAPQGKFYFIAGRPWNQAAFGDKKIAVYVHEQQLIPDYIGPPNMNASVMPINLAADIMVNEHFPESKDLKNWTRLGWVSQAEPTDYKGYTIAIARVVDYTGLQVSHNPALWAIYLGFSLMVVGVFISFYVTHKVIRVSVSPASKGVTVVAGATSRAEPSAFDRDFGALRDALA